MTLLEVLIVVAIVSAATALIFWSAGRWSDRARVEAAAGAVLDAYRRAQSVARAWGRPAELVVTPDSLVIRAVWHQESTEVWRAPGPASGGVAITPTAHVAGFSPSGMAIGVANVSHILTRGTARRQIVVSRLGRAKVLP